MGLVGVVLGLARIVMMLVLLAVRVVLPVAFGWFLYNLLWPERAQRKREERRQRKEQRKARKKPDFRGEVRTVDYRATEETPHM